MDYFKKSLVHQEEIGNDKDISELFFWIIKGALLTGDKHTAREYLLSLEPKFHSNDNVYIHLYYHLSNVLVLMSEMSLLEFAEAKENIENLLQFDIPDAELLLLLKISYLEIVFFEYYNFKKQEVYNDLVSELSQLIQVCKENQLFSYYGEFNLLLAKLSEEKNEYAKAKNILSTSLSMMIEKSLFKIAVRLASEIDKLLNLQYMQSKTKSMTDEHDDLHHIDQITLRSFNLQEDPNYSTIGRIIVILDENWEIMLMKAIDKTGIYQNVIKTIIEYVIDKLQDNSDKDGQVQFFQINEHNVVVHIAEKSYVYVYSGSSYIAAEQLMLFAEQTELNKQIQTYFDTRDPQIGHFFKNEVEKYIRQTFESIEPLQDNNQQPTDNDYSTLDLFLSDVKPYQIFLHPVRLTIMLLLNKNYKLPRSMIQKILKINPGTLKSHLDKLLDLNYVEKKMEFVNETPTDFYLIRHEGTMEFTRFKELMVSNL